jgi:thymidylate kinase
MDGSGKSTQVNYLIETLRKQKTEVIVIHPFGWKIVSLLSRSPFHRSTNGTARKVGHSKSGLSVRLSQLVTWIEICDIALYVWVGFLQYFFYTFLMKRQIWLVSDRSFDDVLVKHMYRKTLTPFVIKMIRRLVPRTEKTIWLQTDPTVAMQRDQEFPKNYYDGLEECYGAAAKQFGWEVISTTDCSPDAVWGNVSGILGLQVNEHWVEPAMVLRPR